MAFEFTYGKKPVRIKANETFTVKMSAPQRDCPCGTPWGELHGIRCGEEFFLRCPKCKREGPRYETLALAVIAWAGAIDREEGPHEHRTRNPR